MSERGERDRDRERSDRRAGRHGGGGGDEHGSAYSSSYRDYDRGGDRYSDRYADRQADRYASGGVRDDRRRRDYDRDADYGRDRDRKYARRDDDHSRGSRYDAPRDYEADRWAGRDRNDGAYRREDPYARRGGDPWRDQPPTSRVDEMMRRSPTPPGTRRISERLRKSNKWDVKPPGFEEMSAQQAKATGLFGTPGQSRGGAGTHAGSSLPPIRMGSDVAGLTDAQRQAAGLNGTLAARGLRRLYVGNVQPMATEGAFMSFFNAKMLEMNFASMPGEPCMSVQVNPDKGWAFLEFRTPEEATNAMGFDGIIFQGASLKIRRPKDYTGPDVNPPSNVHVPGVISTNVPDGPNKIYIGGLPTYLQEEQVIELLKSFGELRAFNLVREAGNGASKGYAFCEYVDHTLTEVACAGLNEMELGDRKLVVQKASSQSGGRNVNPMGATGSNMAPLGAPGAGGLTLPSAAANGTGEPTRAMTMLNMVTPKELEDDTEYGEILEDIAEECSKYGIISDIRIPRPVVQSKGAAAQNWKTTAAGSSGETDAEGKVKEREGVGRVYIRYEQVDQCQQALRGLAGRHFGGRTVICAFINEDDWPADEDGGIGAAGQEVAAA